MPTLHTNNGQTVRLPTERPQRVLPSLMRNLRDAHKGYVLRQTLAEFERKPGCWRNPPPEMVSRLIYGWGNESWSALDEYLVRCIQEASTCDGNILECGSGLTTLLVGIIAKRRRIQVWSLEHNEFWGSIVERHLARRRNQSVHLCIAPLKDYGDFSWYQPPLNVMPSTFSLVICDGPPGSTPGGRVGLVPMMKGRLSPGCTILLDDGEREHERLTASRWSEELRTSFHLCGTTKPYFELRVPD